MIGPRFGLVNCRLGHGMTTQVIGGCEVDLFEEFEREANPFSQSCKCRSEFSCKIENEREADAT